MKMKRIISYLSLATILFASNTLIAQDTLTIGTGTSSSSTRGPLQRSDTNSSTVFSRWVQTYTAAELATAGIINGNSITELQWELASSNTIIGTGNANAKIYIKNSSATAAVSDTWVNLIAGSTLSYDTDYNTTNNFPGANGWMPFVLTSPFVYTGGALEIAVDWDCSTVSTPVFSGDGSLKWRWASTAPDSLVAKRTGSSSAPSTISDLRDERANIQIIHATPAPAGPSGLFEDFSAGSLPTGWSITSVSANDSWFFGGNIDFGPNATIPDASGNTGEYARIDFSNDNDTTSLITPAVYVGGFTNPRLLFSYITQTTSTAFNPFNRLIVDYWNGTAWTNITVIDTLTPSGWTEYSFNAIPYIYSTDSVQFRFSAQEGGAAIGGTGTSTFDQDLAIDEVTIEQTPTCLKPSNLGATATVSGVDFSWTDPNAATSGEIEYGISGYTFGTGTKTIVSSNPANLTGFIIGNTYDWYYRVICGPMDSSVWIQGPSFNFAGAPISGAYTIDSTLATGGTNFQSFSDLAFTLNNAGISGALTVTVMPNTYFDQFSLTNIIGSSATNTIMINGGSAATTTLSHDKSIRNSTITLEGTNYITIKNMTIAATGGTDSWGIQLFNNAQNVLIDSNVLTVPVGTAGDVAAINVSADEASDAADGNNTSDLIISNNIITGGERGISVRGSFTASARNQNVQLLNNNISQADDFGIHLTGYNNVTIVDNSISGLNNVGSDGIYLSDVENFNISRNSAIGRDLGFDADDLNFDNAVTTRSTISNNMFIGGDDAFWLDDVEEIDIFHNSTYAEDRAIHFNDHANIDIRNNIFSSNSDNAIFIDDAIGTLVLDYNVYYTQGTDLANVDGTTYTDFSAFKVGEPTLNLNSASGDPLYSNPLTDLHASSPIANDVGDSTVGITVDFDGDVRPAVGATAVDIGADEFTPASCILPGGLGSDSLTKNTAFVFWTENGTAIEWQIEYGIAGFTQGTGTLITVNTDTFTTLTGLTFETNYDWYLRAVCGRSDTSSFAGPNSFFTGYCSPNPSSVDGQGIIGVAFDTVNNVTGLEAGNYGNYSSFIGSVQQTATANVDITYATGFTYGTAIWVDWNNDLDFDDVGEQVYTGTSLTTNPTTLNASFVVTGAIGQYRMRIGGTDFATITPCYIGSFGVFEDYTLNVTAPPTCVATTANATVVGVDTAAVSWIENGTATQWEVEWDTLGFTSGTGRNSMIVLTDTFFTITGLSPSTTYRWNVRAICGPADSSTWVGQTFNTLIQGPIGVNCTTGNPSVVFAEEFDNNTAGWTGSIGSGAGQWELPDGSGSTNTGADVAHSGANYMNFEASGSPITGGAIVSPAIDLTNAAGDVELSFWIHAFGAAMGDLSVGVGTSATGPFTSVFNTVGQIQTAGSDPWQNVGANLAAFIGQTIYLEFNLTNVTTFTSDMSIDLLEVTTCASCAIPSSSMAVNIALDSATVDWTENGTATTWEISYGTPGTAPGMGTQAITSMKPFNITGLTPSSSYDFYVRAVCAPGDTSNWSSIGSFSTANGIPYAEDFATFPTNQNITTKGWTNSAGSAAGVADWTALSGPTPSGSTGPNVDHTLGTAAGVYLYLETSAGILGIRDTLSSPIVLVEPTQDSLTYSYWYHMAGTTMGDLHVWVESNGVWDSLTTFTGTQHAAPADPWLQASHQLNGYAGQNITLRFIGERGSSFTGDMAIDDISIVETLPCMAPVANMATNLRADSVDVSWIAAGAGSATASSYMVEWDLAGFTPGSGSNSMVITGTSTTIAGLTAGTNYEYNVRAICAVGDTSAASNTIAFTTAAIAVVTPYYPIATINTEDATTGVADSTGVTCFTSGTVVGIDLDGNNGISFTIIDQSSGSQEGINIFNFNDVSGYVVAEGDSIMVRGDVGQFNGLTQVFTDSIMVISTGSAIPTPTVVTTLDETTESNHISLLNSYEVLDTYTSGSNNLRMVNGTDTLVMRIDSDTDIDDTLAALAISIIPGDTICGVAGIGGQFNGGNALTGYQIFPMRWSDLTICRDITTGINDVDASATAFQLVPNPTNGTFEIRSNGFNNPTINISIRDINGRVISSEFVNNASGNFNKSFDLNEEAGGIYFITILDGENVINKKLIVQ